MRLIEYAYDGQGNLARVTSYDGTSGGTILGEVVREFDGLGQVTAEYQSHSGGVNTSTSPKVQYAYSEMPSGADHSRLTSVTYPDGYVLTYNYLSGLNDSVSRLSSLSDSTGTLEGYDYLGLATVVRRAHPQPGVDLSYVKRTGESTGDAGDEYAGLDRFGRVVDQRWLDPTSGTATDRFQYAYDLVGNRSYRDNLVNSAFGELYSYDDLSQLLSFQRGTLNGTKTGITGTASRSQSWDLDAAGNFDTVTTDGTSQPRTANAQNQITSIGGATTPSYDSNGNMIGDETGRQFVYDAWNRLVAVKNSSGTTLKTYGYDGLNRKVSETAGGATTDLYYSSDWQVLSEKVGSSYTKRYVWSPVYVDAMVLRDRDTDANGSLDERLWVQQDANWNVTALVNGSGAVVERYVYDPYGAVTIYDASYSTARSNSSYAMTYYWQGRPLDAVSQTYDFRNREVSPTLGRPIQVDMLRFGSGDVNFYRWEGNGPVNRNDPAGLAPTEKEIGDAIRKRAQIARAYADQAKRMCQYRNSMLPTGKQQDCDRVWVQTYLDAIKKLPLEIGGKKVPERDCSICEDLKKYMEAKILQKKLSIGAYNCAEGTVIIAVYHCMAACELNNAERCDAEGGKKAFEETLAEGGDKNHCRLNTKNDNWFKVNDEEFKKFREESHK